MITYKDCPECGTRKIHESVNLCEVCETWAKAEQAIAAQDEILTRRYNEQLARAEQAEKDRLDQVKQSESLKAQLDLAHKFHDVAVAERNHARHLLGEVLAVLNGDGGHAVQELGWDAATKRGLARYHDMLARAHGCVMYPCDCTYPRDGQADPNCAACNGLGAITKKEI